MANSLFLTNLRRFQPGCSRFDSKAFLPENLAVFSLIDELEDKMINVP